MLVSFELSKNNFFDGVRLPWEDFVIKCSINKKDLQVPQREKFSGAHIEATFILAQDHLAKDGVMVCKLQDNKFM